MAWEPIGCKGRSVATHERLPPARETQFGMAGKHPESHSSRVSATLLVQTNPKIPILLFRHSMFDDTAGLGERVPELAEGVHRCVMLMRNRGLWLGKHQTPSRMQWRDWWRWAQGSKAHAEGMHGATSQGCAGLVSVKGRRDQGTVHGVCDVVNCAGACECAGREY
jgi:hypothetical protein